MTHAEARSPLTVPAVVVGTLLPLIALVVVFGLDGHPIRFLQECGAWGYAIIFAVVVFGLGSPALAGFTRTPSAIWAGTAAVPVVAGVLGVVVSAANVKAAIANVNFADRLVIAATGTGEVAGIFVLACVVGGACVAAVGTVAVVKHAGPGGGLVVGAGAVAFVLGMRWLFLRNGLSAVGMLSPADRATVLASSIQEAQLLSFVLIGVSVVAVVAALALGITRKQAMSVAGNAGLAVVAVVVAACAAGGHLALNGMTAMPAPFPPGRQLVQFPSGADFGPPPGHVINRGKVVDDVSGDPSSFALDVTATSADVRAALPHGPTDPDPAYDRARLYLVGPSSFSPPPDVAIPAVFAGLLRLPIGVEVGVFHGDDVVAVAVVGGVDPSPLRAATRVPVVVVGKDELKFDYGPVAVVFANDLSGADFAKALTAIAAAQHDGHPLLVLRSEP